MNHHSSKFMSTLFCYRHELLEVKTPGKVLSQQFENDEKGLRNQAIYRPVQRLRMVKMVDSIVDLSDFHVYIHSNSVPGLQREASDLRHLLLRVECRVNLVTRETRFQLTDRRRSSQF